MKNNSSETPMKKIDFLLKRLVDFSNENKFDFTLYKTFAEESGKTFNRYFAQIDNEADKEKIISNLNEDFHLFIDNLSTNISSSNRNNGSTSIGTVYIAPSTPDNRINGYEKNYKQLKELFLNTVQLLEAKTPTVPAPETKKTLTNYDKITKELQSSILTNRQMEDNKTFHTHINIRGYEEDYNTKKMVFLMNNPEKTEKNFIENTIMEINSQKLEWERKCNLTEDEVYNECKNDKRYIDSVENGFGKEKYLEPLLKELAYAFKRRYNKEGITNKPSTKSIFYKTKLKNLQVPETTNNIEEEEKTPYKIALLKELGFFDLDKIKNKTKENQYNIILKLIGGTSRTVKGNVLVLNPEGKEDRLKYTANNHLDKVKDYLDKLK